jgi:hypothetical protein
MKRTLWVFLFFVFCASLWGQTAYLGKGMWLYDAWMAFRRWDFSSSSDSELQRKAVAYVNYIQATIDTTRYFDPNLLPNDLNLRASCYKVGRYLEKNFDKNPVSDKTASLWIIEALEKKKK